MRKLRREPREHETASKGFFGKLLFRGQRPSHGLFVMGPQNERDAATIDHFGREPFEHALGCAGFHLAAAQAFEATPLHLLLRRSGREDFRKPPQRFLESNRLIETIPQSRVVGRGRKRPELDRPEAC